MSWKSSGAARSNNFDFLRFALATLVIYSHSFDLKWWGDHELLNRLSRHQLSFGELSVDMFFVMSGFLITHSWLRSKHLYDFLQKRVLRIYPAFIVAVTLTVFLIGPVAVTGKFHVEIGRMIAGLLNLRGYEPANLFLHNPAPGVLNGSLWSISYEFWCYIGVALLGLVAALKFPRAMLAMFLISIGVGAMFAAHPQFKPGGKFLGLILGNPRFWARLLPYYMAGVVFYLWRDRIPQSPIIASLALMLAAAGFLIPKIGVAIFFPLAATYLIFYVAYLPIPGLWHWAKFGDFSYGMYLYAFPIQQWIVMHNRDISPTMLFALAAPATLIAAIASWYLVERPFLKMKKRPARQLPDAELHQKPNVGQVAAA